METGEIKQKAVAIKFSGTIEELCKLIEVANFGGHNIKVNYAGKTFYSFLSDEHTIYTTVTGYSKQEFEAFFEGKEVVDPEVSRKQARVVLKQADGEVYSDRKAIFAKIIEGYAITGRLEFCEKVIRAIIIANKNGQSVISDLNENFSGLSEKELNDALLLVIEHSKEGHELYEKMFPEKAIKNASFLSDLKIKNKMAKLAEMNKNAGSMF